MKRVDEDPLFPRLYGDLIDTGMSLSEIRKHNIYEVLAMKNALYRYRLLSEGQGISEDMRKRDPGARKMYEEYRNEALLYKEFMDEVRKRTGE